jgi:chaperone required for assembly of F1-ATPase
MRRFYKAAEVVAVAGGFGVSLDGKPVNTPAKSRLAVPTRPLAEAIAAEWRAQGERLTPRLMPLTRLASTAIDLVMPRRAAVIEGVATYAATDLVCYRADHPPALAARQHAAWQPLLDWASRHYDAPLHVTVGILPQPQPAASLQALAAAVAAYDAMTLAALNLATAACGSLVVALALIEGRIDADAAFDAAELEQTFEIEQWGEDLEQTSRRAQLKDDIVLARRFVALLREQGDTGAVAPLL